MPTEDTVDTELITPAQRVYVGAAWRARFLRAPKMALELAARQDFVPLQSLASVKLGLKTGADSFFFVERVGGKATRDAELISRRGVVAVRGQEGWLGELDKSDLRPAVLNPHQLFSDDGRLFTIPADTKHLYLYPSSTKLRNGLAEYVRVGELHGVHQGDLVKSNGSEGGWYKQVRSLTTSEWVLPYNSAYDYSAWNNPHRAVLNGRFVGVDANNGIDSDLLGAALNSTFAAVGRLIEGVATGVEGAFDVGPPAARRIMLPDIGRFDAEARQNVLKVLHQIRSGGAIVAAPLRDGYAPPLRWQLDTALLMALGLTRGQAIAFLERLYVSYGRWRASIEDVETQMRANRRQMQATGQSRTQRPTEAAGRRVWEEIEHLVPIFPKSYLPADEVVELINVPSNAVIPVSEPLFETGVVRTKSKTIDLKSYNRVRYVGMLRTLGLTGNVEVPISEPKAAAIADLFDGEQEKFSAVASGNAAKYVSGSEAIKEVVDIARKHWHAACRKSALSKPKPTKGKSKLN